MTDEDKENLTSKIIYSCLSREKTAWVKAAQRDQRKLVDWLVEAANEKLVNEHPKIAEKFGISKNT